jgi:hypothetical protein
MQNALTKLACGRIKEGIAVKKIRKNRANAHDPDRQEAEQ